MLFMLCNSVNHLMKEFNGTWCIAGGWAIDLYLGEQTRAHEDIEIIIFREDQHKLKRHLRGWEISKVEGEKLSVWESEYLELPVHELHATHKVTGQKIEILLNEKEENNWLFRRDIRIRRPLNEIIAFFKSDIPYLRPEIVLLYKAKQNGLKDTHDFNKAIRVMDDNQKKWLKDMLNIHLPNHNWLNNL